jgi:hypothetical protein
MAHYPLWPWLIARRSLVPRPETCFASSTKTLNSNRSEEPRLKVPKAGLFFGLCMVLVVTSSVTAGWVDLGGQRDVTVAVTESSPTRIALEFRVGGFDRQDIVIQGRTYSLISLPGEAERLQAGWPELPVVARSVIIPDDRRMELRVRDIEYTDLPGITPVPSKGDLSRTVDPAQIPYTFDAFYAGSAWYPEEDAAQREPYILRDFRATTVLVTPIRYQPSTGTLRVATRMVVELVDAGPGGANNLTRDPAARSSVVDSFDEIYRGHFLNYGARSEKYAVVPETGSMLVICADSFAPAMQPFLDWKNQSGLPTTMVLMSQVGTTPAQVQACITSRYNASGSPKLAFVLLVGDAAQVPTPISDGGAADPTYGKISGDDWYPEVMIGRFSAENIAQVQTQVLRSVTYEKEPLLAGGDWHARGVGIASNQGPGDDFEYDNQHVRKIRTKLMNYGYASVDSVYDPWANAAMVTTALNEGRGIINFCGHGDLGGWGTSGFNWMYVNALANGNRLPVIFSVACANGQFSGETCFAESWLRAVNNGVPTGAVAAYMSSSNQSWNPPMAAQDEANDLLVTNRARTFGSLCFNGSCLMIDQYGAAGAPVFNTWIIFGDPSLRVRTKAPTPILATHQDSLGSSDLELQVVTDCPGAICGLASGGTFLGSAVADTSGQATLVVAGALPPGQNVSLTVTGANRIPYIGQIPVRPLSQPVVTINPSWFDIAANAGSVVQDTLRIINTGGGASPATFTLHFTPISGGTFLSFAPDHGQVPYGETTGVVISFSDLGFRSGSYVGLIHLLYDAGQVIEAPAALQIGGAADIGGPRAAPTTVWLEEARPNPFVSTVDLHFGLPAAQAASLTVYDASGRAVRTLAGGAALAGYHVVEWNGCDDAGRVAPTGVYFARLQTAERTVTRRLIRIR